jgi:glutamyl-tRNA synthetase
MTESSSSPNQTAPDRPRRTRLAPSPTGGLHLGNARTFALTWALARNLGWEVLLRIEDLDRERVKPGAVDETRAILDWLGLDHDGPVTIQSEHVDRFWNALKDLAADGCSVFRCDRSRKDVRSAASAPHREDGEIRYPPSLRPPVVARGSNDAHGQPDPFTPRDRHANYRFVIDPGAEAVEDQLAGHCVFHPGEEVGDMLVWMKMGAPSYQLAVVVDDAHQGITDVMRGDDLLPSAARQQLLYRALGADIPNWWHLPLVVGPDGERLAKRHDDLSLASLRAAGVRRERVLGLLAHWCGDHEESTLPDGERSIDDFRAGITPATLQALVARERCDGIRPDRRCVLSEDLIRWLLDRSEFPSPRPSPPERRASP